MELHQFLAEQGDPNPEVLAARLTGVAKQTPDGSWRFPDPSNDGTFTTWQAYQATAPTLPKSVGEALATLSTAQLRQIARRGGK